MIRRTVPRGRWRGAREGRTITLSDLHTKKREGRKITVLTAYDYPFARLISQAGIDIIVVNDGVIGGIAMGRGEGFSTTIDEVVHHTRAVKAGAGGCVVVSSMVFGSYNTPEDAVVNATTLIKEGHADAVHIEGDRSVAPAVRAITDAGIPVVGHIGLTKQIIARTGQTRLQAKDAAGILSLYEDAEELVEAGACSMVLECIPDSVARVMTNSLPVPTIGIGAGVHCDGQFLVAQDLLNLLPGFSARFLKRYADLSEIVVEAFTDFRREVESGAFPDAGHSYRTKSEELSRALTELTR